MRTDAVQESKMSVEGLTQQLDMIIGIIGSKGTYD